MGNTWALQNKFLEDQCFKKKSGLIFKFITVPIRLTGYSSGNSEPKSKAHMGR